MEKSGKKDKLYIFILVAMVLAIFILRTGSGHIAGAKMDWLDQHSVFPDYFRKLFYQTGNLFPQYAAGLGGGQNIYNFAYYGLFNPLYLFSYLFPFIKMSVYIQLVSLLEHVADGILCYVWLKGRAFGAEESFFASGVLILAAPVTFHSATQLMFINYMPFLLLALIGYDQYVRTGKYALMMWSVLFIILNSFYFAVGAMVALFIYVASEYRFERGTSMIRAVKWLWHQLYPALLGCLLSVFYLAPVYFAMTAGRNDRAVLSLKELLLPDAKLHKFLYSPYGLGLSVAALVILCISLFYRRCRERTMAVILMVLCLFPVFDWLLNGGLYLRSKAFIPFLPLVCWLCAAFFRRIRRREIRVFQAACGYVLAVVLILWLGKMKEYAGREAGLVWIDFAVCGVLLILSLSVWKQAVSLGLIGVMGIISVVQIHVYQEKMVTEKFIQSVEDVDTQRAVSGILSKDRGFYRTEVRKTYDQNRANQNRVIEHNQNLTTVYSSVENTDYQSFRDNVIHLSRPYRNKLMEAASDNPVFLRFMGVKYIVGDSAPADYQKIASVGKEQIFENKQAAPVAYVTDRIMPEAEFARLSYPEKQMALLKSAVADDTKDAQINAGDINVMPCLSEIQEEKDEAITVQNTERGTKVQASRDHAGSITLSNKVLTDGYLFMTFDVKNNKPSKDVVVTVNGERNKLSSEKAPYYNGNTTFHYACAVSKGTEQLPVLFGKGDYEISNRKVWFGVPDANDTRELYQAPVNIQVKGGGNVLGGQAEAAKDGWLITSIPYDKDFTALVDGKEVKVQKVNTGFVGLPLSKGRHEIKLVYHARGQKAGILVTLGTLGIVWVDYMRRRKYGSSFAKCV